MLAHKAATKDCHHGLSVAIVTKFWGFTRRSGVWQLSHKHNRPHINYPLCRSSDFHTHFLNYRPSQNKTHGDSVSSVLLKHNSVQQHTRPGQCSTCIELHDYKLVVKHYFPPPKRPSPTPTVRSPPSFYTAQLPGPPRISLNRRVQLQTFITQSMVSKNPQVHPCSFVSLCTVLLQVSLGLLLFLWL